MPPRGVTELSGLLQPDGSLIVPPEVAADLLRVLVLGLSARVQRDGGHLSPRTRTILLALHEAAERHEETITPTLISQPGVLTVAETAERMECSTRWVRHLLTTGRLQGRKVGGVWLVDSSPLPASEASRDAA